MLIEFRVTHGEHQYGQSIEVQDGKIAQAAIQLVLALRLTLDQLVNEHAIPRHDYTWFGVEPRQYRDHDMIDMELAPRDGRDVGLMLSSGKRVIATWDPAREAWKTVTPDAVEWFWEESELSHWVVAWFAP